MLGKYQPSGSLKQMKEPGGVRVSRPVSAGKPALGLAGQGLSRAGYHSHGGMLIQGLHKIPVREERQLFDVCDVPWSEPEAREV